VHPRRRRVRLKAGGVSVSSTPRTERTARPNAEGVSVRIGPMSRHATSSPTSSGRPVPVPTATPFGVVVLWSHDRGPRRNAATPGCQRESLRGFGAWCGSTRAPRRRHVVGSRGCRRLVGRPDQRRGRRATERRRRFPWDRPNVAACATTSSRRQTSCPFPRRPLRGRGRLVA
jgi:hypothetical protein